MASSESVLESVGFVLQTWVWCGLGCRSEFGGLVLSCRRGFGVGMVVVHLSCHGHGLTS
uniref:Uncharacterized protein n=1 Tax=Fagus sylvatica TaxID=28930 RepID=A0A2N9IG41_FAGSY